MTPTTQAPATDGEETAGELERVAEAILEGAADSDDADRVAAADAEIRGLEESLRLSESRERGYQLAAEHGKAAVGRLHDRIAALEGDLKSAQIYGGHIRTLLETAAPAKLQILDAFIAALVYANRPLLADEDPVADVQTSGSPPVLRERLLSWCDEVIAASRREEKNKCFCDHTGTCEYCALRATPEPAPASGGGGESAYLIQYEDSDMKTETFIGAGAKEGAFGRFEQLRPSWNVHLFERIRASYPLDLDAARPDTEQKEG